MQQLALLALLPLTLALPSNLTRRDMSPSIAPYNDDVCTKQAAPSKDFGNGCIKVDFTNNNVGINWGEWFAAMDSFDVFSDDKCTNYASKTIVYDKLGFNKVGANSCYKMAEHGGPWKSVKQHYVDHY